MAGRSAVKKVGQLGFGRLLGFIALGALVLRLIARWQHGTANYWDEGYGFYFNIARNLAQGRGYELVAGKLTAFRVPGYPIFLLAITGGDWHPWTIVTVQAVIGALSVAATGLIGRELFGGRTGLIAAGTCALYPYYVIHDTALQETALVTCLSAWGTFLLLRMARTGSLWLALFAGAMLAAAVLTRETVLPFALCAALWGGWRVAALNGVARGVLASAGLLTVLGAGLTPWLLHTQHEYGEYVLGNEFGAALYAGSDPLLFTAYPDGSVDDSRDLIFRAISPLDQAKLARFKVYPRVRYNLLRDRAIERIEADPIGFSWRFAQGVDCFPSAAQPLAWRLIQSGLRACVAAAALARADRPVAKLRTVAARFSDLCAVRCFCGDQRNAVGPDRTPGVLGPVPDDLRRRAGQQLAWNSCVAAAGRIVPRQRARRAQLTG